MAAPWLLGSGRISGTLFIDRDTARSLLLSHSQALAGVRVHGRVPIVSQSWIPLRSIKKNFLLRAQFGDERAVVAAANPSPLAHSSASPNLAHEEETLTLARSLFGNWKPPRYLWRALATLIITGQVIVRILQRRVHWRNTLLQMEAVGPHSLGVCLLTASFVGMAFTIQFVREFARLGLTRAVGGVLSLALARELSPVVTAIIIAGRVGSAFAAELGTMQVSEQTDTLRVLRTDPVDYLVTPRVIACCIALPILTLISFTVGLAASVLLADSVYSVSANIILDSAKKALHPWDFISTMIKSTVFGGIISVVSCAWGVTTLGGAKGVGESTTSAVVISLVWVFIADFVLSWCFFQGAGDALKRMG